MGCRFHDDMDIIRKAFEKCNGIILGVPIYYGTMPAQVKLMVDRSYCFAKRVILPSGEFNYQTTIKKPKKGFLISIAHVHLQQQSVIDSLHGWGNEINLRFINDVHVRLKDLESEVMENESIKQDFFKRGRLFYDAIV